MKEGRDFSLIYHINCHYFDLTEDIAHINSFEEFVDAKEIRRAILFDFLQIGKLLRQRENKPLLKRSKRRLVF